MLYLYVREYSTNQINDDTNQLLESNEKNIDNPATYKKLNKLL